MSPCHAGRMKKFSFAPNNASILHNSCLKGILRDFAYSFLVGRPEVIDRHSFEDGHFDRWCRWQKLAKLAKLFVCKPNFACVLRTTNELQKAQCVNRPSSPSFLRLLKHYFLEERARKKHKNLGRKEEKSTTSLRRPETKRLFFFPVPRFLDDENLRKGLILHNFTYERGELPRWSQSSARRQKIAGFEKIEHRYCGLFFYC